MSDDNTQDAAEPSPASVGSQPVAWAAIGKNGQPMWLSYSRQDAEGAVVGMADVVPLYRQPQPTLTDAEREAIEWAINKTAQAYDDAEGGPMKREAMRGLLRRTK
jgi:hypothetical protein